MSDLKEVCNYLKEIIPLKDGFYFVGGTVRDELLQRPYNDFDLATPYKPEELYPFVKNEKHFSSYAMKYGGLDFRVLNHPLTITTFRKENDYSDHRHPGEIIFIKDYKTDALRRDFTINAMYFDENLHLLDPLDGEADLDQKLIRMIGDPEKRIREDPLRILRAYRFKEELGFTIERNLLDCLESHLDLLKEIRPEKIIMELRKFPKDRREVYQKKVSSVLE